MYGTTIVVSLFVLAGLVLTAGNGYELVVNLARCQWALAAWALLGLVLSAGLTFVFGWFLVTLISKGLA